MKWLYFSSLCYNNFHTKTQKGDKITDYELRKNAEAQQGSTNENTGID